MEPSTLYRGLCRVLGCIIRDGLCLNCGALKVSDPAPAKPLDTSPDPVEAGADSLPINQENGGES